MFPTLADLERKLDGDPVGRNFLKHLEIGPVPEHAPEMGPCVRWTGALSTPHNYGSFRVPTGDPQRRQRTVRVHRWLYIRLHGPIAPGLEVAHLCCDPDRCTPGPNCPHRQCVVHTALKTKADNIREGGSFAGVLARRTRCRGKNAPPGGHDLTIEANVIRTTVRAADGTQRTRRHCRPCKQQTWRDYEARDRANQRELIARRAGRQLELAI